jgi:hypothetical protein
MKTMEITISPEGEVATDMKSGWKGTECTEFTKKLENSLGSVSECKKKQEFYHKGTTKATVRT